MKQYLDLLNKVLTKGAAKSDRTGTGTRSLFGEQLRFNLAEGFPLVTTKKIHMRSVIHELLWFLKGDTNIEYLTDNGVHIWDDWADEDGELGPVYGKQWRQAPSHEFSNNKLGYIDQIANLMKSLKEDPDSRRHIVSAWNVSQLEDMALAPCHCLFQFYVVDNKLSCQLYQRSADMFLGVSFNIASYALLTEMIAHVLGLEVGEFIHTFGDVHLYNNHVEQAKLQLTREPFSKPVMYINRKVDSIFDFKYEDFDLCYYQSHPAIKAKVAV